MQLPAIIAFIRRFGWKRGREFRRIARKCDHDPHLLESWATHYRAKASREFYHDNNADGRLFLAFAEMLQTTHDQLIAKRKPRRPILSKRMQRIEKRLNHLDYRRKRFRHP